MKRIAISGLIAVATLTASMANGQTTSTSIGYPTVAAALEALHSRSDVKFSVRGGWTVAEDATNHTIWSFPPEGNPAYPAAVKRVIVEQAGALYVNMNVLCGATKPGCDKLVADFEQLNQNMKNQLSQHR